MAGTRRVTIVVPVYGDWPSLKECIESLKAHVDTSRHSVLLVNDCGPDAELMETNINAAIKGWAGAQYHRNPKNLGFVGTCNRAVLELDPTDNDILLLNSDTKVTPHFLDELLGVLEADDKIGVVTPRSNNASIATFPLWAASQHGIDMDKSYALYQSVYAKLPPYFITPVAHGFCMLIKRPLIKLLGLFDPVFGKGYGEEEDFCQRVRADGYLCAFCNRAYVFHLEAKSFSMEAKQKMIQTNATIINERYPGYRQEVRDYVDWARAQEDKVLQPAGKLGAVKRLIRKHPKLHRAIRKLKR